MLKRKQNGFVIELMIVFMLVTFGFCMLVTTFMGTLNVERKYAREAFNMQTDLNQIGEYYIRYIEESGKQFPKGNETTFTDEKYSWMDDEAKEFFKECNQKYNFEYVPSFSITRGGLLEFFKTKYIWRKLVVKGRNDNKIQMLIELKETRVSDTETEYYIQNWSVGDGLIDETAEEGGYQKDELTTLQKLWKFLGLEINSIADLRNSGDWWQFFRTSISNFDEAMNDSY